MTLSEVAAFFIKHMWHLVRLWARTALSAGRLTHFLDLVWGSVGMERASNLV